MQARGKAGRREPGQSVLAWMSLAGKLCGQEERLVERTLEPNRCRAAGDKFRSAVHVGTQSAG